MIIWAGICIVSVVWGGVHYKSGYTPDLDKHNSYFKFLEFWRPCINYFIALVLVYYFVSVRWTYISQDGGPSVGDFILGAVFLAGVFGWLPYFIKNITEGINVIFGKIFNK